MKELAWEIAETHRAMRRYYDRLNLPPDPSLFDRSDAIAVLEEILPTLPLVHYRNLWDPSMVLKTS